MCPSHPFSFLSSLQVKSTFDQNQTLIVWFECGWSWLKVTRTQVYIDVCGVSLKHRSSLKTYWNWKGNAGFAERDGLSLKHRSTLMCAVCHSSTGLHWKPTRVTHGSVFEWLNLKVTPTQITHTHTHIKRERERERESESESESKLATTFDSGRRLIRLDLWSAETFFIRIAYWSSET